MVSRNEKLELVLQGAADMSKAALEKRAKKAADRKAAGKTTTRDLEAIWREALREKYGVQYVVSPWGGAECSLVKTMLGTWGVETVEKMLRTWVGTWTERAAKRGWDGVPTIKFLWVCRDTIYGEVLGVAEVGGPKQAKKDEGEYRSTEAAKGPGVGW